MACPSALPQRRWIGLRSGPSRHRRVSGSPVALPLLALPPPCILIGFDGSRFAAGALDTGVEVSKKDVRPFFSNAQLVRS
jgi:hypothetical protein